jgi:hydroxyacylglutathione hydrolase
MVIDTLVVGGLETNCYILKNNGNSVIIDPGAEPERIMRAIKDLKVEIILVTHRHCDHVDALKDIKAATKARAAIHSDDWIDGFDVRLHGGQTIQFGTETIRVIHTPGHTAGGCCFLLGNTLFSGDTLFPGGPGNTSFSGGNEQAIYKSIREKLMILPDNTRIYPGHGPSTSIGAERGLY